MRVCHDDAAWLTAEVLHKRHGHASDDVEDVCRRFAHSVALDAVLRRIQREEEQAIAQAEQGGTRAFAEMIDDLLRLLLQPLASLAAGCFSGHFVPRFGPLRSNAGVAEAERRSTTLA
jgi:hypothetical protein